MGVLFFLDTRRSFPSTREKGGQRWAPFFVLGFLSTYRDDFWRKFGDFILTKFEFITMPSNRVVKFKLLVFVVF